MLLNYIQAKYRFQNWDTSNIKSFQERKFHDIVRFATSNSSWYKKFYQNVDLNNLWNLPKTNKELLVTNFTNANTLGLEKEDIFDFVEQVEKTRDFSKRYQGINIGMSSGTSGNRGLEVVTPEEERLLRAIFFARFPYNFFLGERMNLAFVLRVSAPAFRLGFLGHRLTYVSLGEPWKNIVSNLTQINPNVLSAPPSFLLRVAQSKKKGEISISPKTIISYAEPLYPEIKDILAEVFGVKVIHEIYKATEGAFANSCKYGTLHWNEDLVVVQLYDKYGTEIEFNQPSDSMVITNLYKEATPIIRYEMNDIIELSDAKCPCGSRFRIVKQIQGRCDDIIVGRSNHDSSQYEHLYPDYFRRAIISFNPKIVDYQVIQKDLEHLVVRYRAETPVNEPGLVDALKTVYYKYDCKLPKILVLNETPDLHPRSLKLRRVIREFELEL